MLMELGGGIQDNQLFFLGYSNVSQVVSAIVALSECVLWLNSKSFHEIFAIFQDGSVRIVFDFCICYQPESLSRVSLQYHIRPAFCFDDG